MTILFMLQYTREPCTGCIGVISVVHTKFGTNDTLGCLMFLLDRKLLTKIQI